MEQIGSKKISGIVKKKRKSMGLTQKEFSDFLGLNSSGERTVRGWENGEHIPSDKKLEEILSMNRNAPFKGNSGTAKFRFIDLFAGIGGIRIPFQEMGGECVFTSEWDKFSKKTYAANYGKLPHGDITQIPNIEIPDHDILLAGFPCQAFSQAGLKQGFQDTRGTLFFEIQRILAEKRPKAFLLENVKQLRGHNKGRTLETILKILRGENIRRIPKNIEISDEARASLGEKLGYYVDFRILRACDFGVPQNRERIYIVGFDKKSFPNIDLETAFVWPKATHATTRLGDILEDNRTVDPKYTISDKLWHGHQRRKAEHKEKGNGFGYSIFTPDSHHTNTISARYYKDGSEILIDQSDIGANPRKLTPRECARLQGFPENFIVDAVSDVQAYKQFGNSVAVPVIRQIALAITKVLEMQNQSEKKEKKAA